MMRSTVAACSFRMAAQVTCRGHPEELTGSTCQLGVRRTGIFWVLEDIPRPRTFSELALAVAVKKVKDMDLLTV